MAQCPIYLGLEDQMMDATIQFCNFICCPAPPILPRLFPRPIGKFVHLTLFEKTPFTDETDGWFHSKEDAAYEEQPGPDVGCAFTKKQNAADNK